MNKSAEQYEELGHFMLFKFDLICTIEELDIIIDLAIKVAEKQEKVTIHDG
jgi:hypothetical protein